MYAKFAQYYDQLTENINYAKRADYFCEIIRRHYRGGERLLLDLACGTGTLSFQLAQRGWDVIGVDASEEMLVCAMQKLAAYDGESRPLFLCQEMTDLDLFGTVGVCVCALDSINHIIGITALQSVFGRLSLFIETGGILVFDANTPYKHQRVLKDRSFVYETDQVYCVWQNSLGHDDLNTVCMDLDFFEKNANGLYRRYSESFSECAYTENQLASAGEKAGFKLLAVYTADTFSPAQDDAQRLVYVMQNNTVHQAPPDKDI